MKFQVKFLQVFLKVFLEKLADEIQVKTLRKFFKKNPVSNISKKMCSSWIYPLSNYRRKSNCISEKIPRRFPGVLVPGVIHRRSIRGISIDTSKGIPVRIPYDTSREIHGGIPKKNLEKYLNFKVISGRNGLRSSSIAPEKFKRKSLLENSLYQEKSSEDLLDIFFLEIPGEITEVVQKFLRTSQKEFTEMTPRQSYWKNSSRFS